MTRGDLAPPRRPPRADAVVRVAAVDVLVDWAALGCLTIWMRLVCGSRQTWSVRSPTGRLVVCATGLDRLDAFLLASAGPAASYLSALPLLALAVSWWVSRHEAGCGSRQPVFWLSSSSSG